MTPTSDDDPLRTSDYAANAKTPGTDLSSDVPPASDIGIEALSPAEQATTLHRLGPDASSLDATQRADSPESLPSVRGYEIKGVLGRGGMGVVYKARHLGLKRIVALKMILAAEHAGDEERSRFRAEAEAIAKLRHPNIVQIYDSGEERGKAYFALEFVEGGSLAAKLRGEPQPPGEAAQVIEILARAMEAAHQKGILHRDLKPANVLLAIGESPSGTGAEVINGVEPSADRCPLTAYTLKITDFGLAKSLDEDAGRTQSGVILGTPSYMSPEQAAGRIHAIGPATDVYALGAMLYELVTGRPPFRGASVFDTLELVRTQEPVAPGQLIPKLPRDVETICLKCLEKDATRRYSSAAALAEDLHRYLEDRPISARPIGRWEQTRKFARRNKVLVGSSIAVTLVLVFGIIGTSLGMARAWQAEGVARANLDRALEAEMETRRDLARSYWDNARLEAGHGRWRQAITLYDRTLEAGFEDDIAVRLERIKALLALHESKRAKQEIATLGQRADLGDRQSVLLLLRGDLALGQSSGQEQALADVRRALKAGLPPEDAAFAQGLLADWPQDAAQHLRRALKLKPAHPDARQLLLPILMSLGRFDECREEAHTLLAFFPEDPSPKILLAVLHLLEGDVKTAAARVRETEAQLGKERVAVLLEAVELLHTALEAAATSDQPTVSPLLLWRLTLLMNKFRKVDAQGLSVLNFHAVNLPALDHVWKPIYPALTAFYLGGPNEEIAAQLDELVVHHPEGLAYFLHAMMNVARASKHKGAVGLASLRKAELSFRHAMDGPCTLPLIRRLARFWGTYAQAILAKPNPKLAPADGDMRARALSNMRLLLADGRLSPDRWASLTELAMTNLEEHDLARMLASAGERQAPRDIRFVRLRAQIELAAGAYHPALEAANKVLARLPKDGDALRVRKEARDKLRASAR